jgi:adenylate cyclase
VAIEIERKFLLASAAWRPAVERSVRMAQGYLNDAGAVESGRQRASVRVRIAGDAAFLNLKSRELGHTRQEFDYAIPVADAEALLPLCSGGLIDKIRHYAGRWEIDEFLGDNAGLFVAEIELAAADETFERPAWLGAEVTDTRRYYNLALSERPFARWTHEERQGCF